MPTTPAPIFPVKATRDTYIYYPEQALVESIFLYKTKLAGPAANNIKIALDSRAIGSVATPVIKLSAKLPFTFGTALAEGGDFITTLVQNVKIACFPPSAIPTAPQTNPAPMPADPSWLQNIEQYIYWVASLIDAGNKAAQTPDTGLISISTIFDPATPLVDIEASLPYDLAVYGSVRSLFQAVKQTISLPSGTGGTGTGGGGTGHVSPEPFAGDSNFWNDSFFAHD